MLLFSIFSAEQNNITAENLKKYFKDLIEKHKAIDFTNLSAIKNFILVYIQFGDVVLKNKMNIKNFSEENFSPQKLQTMLIEIQHLLINSEKSEILQNKLAQIADLIFTCGGFYRYHLHEALKNEKIAHYKPNKNLLIQSILNSFYLPAKPGYPYPQQSIIFIPKFLYRVIKFFNILYLGDIEISIQDKENTQNIVNFFKKYDLDTNDANSIFLVSILTNFELMFDDEIKESKALNERLQEFLKNHTKDQINNLINKCCQQLFDRIHIHDKLLNNLLNNSNINDKTITEIIMQHCNFLINDIFSNTKNTIETIINFLNSKEAEKLNISIIQQHEQMNKIYTMSQKKENIEKAKQDIIQQIKEAKIKKIINEFLK